MLKGAIIADDFTGANATGVLLKERGFNTATYFNADVLSEESRLDVASVSTNSRGMEPSEAYEVVYKTAKKLSGITPYISKRIDSTLRGNLGSEIDAMLDAMGEGYKAVVVPAYPQAGRTCVGGCLLINGTPLELTEVAMDPKSPITSSAVGEVIAAQSRRGIGYVPISAVLKGQIERYMDSIDDDIIVIDAVSDDDIENIATALKRYGNIVCVDPGPFTAAYISAKHGGMNIKNIFLLIGSVSALTSTQVKYLRQRRNIFICKIDIDDLFLSPDAVCNNAIQTLEKNYCDGLIMGVTTKERIDIKAYSHRLNISAEKVSVIINDVLSRITCHFIKNRSFSDLYVTGGDTALSLFTALNADKFTVKDEVLPLAVYGTTEVNGRPLNIVTKGGLVGGQDALYNIVLYLESLGKGDKRI